MPQGHSPPQEKPKNDDGYFEEMTKAVFRSGFRWEIVENKWPNFQKAFRNFSVDEVSAFDGRDVERLLEDSGIVRNGRKIEATIHNARALKATQTEFGSFVKFLRTLDDLEYKDRAKAISSRFRYLGRTGTFTFLWGVAEDVPAWEER